MTGIVTSLKTSLVAEDSDEGARRWREARMVLICCHDAGGAEVLSEWVRAESDKVYRFLLDGPAATIFRRKFGHLPLLDSAAAYAGLSTVDFVLTGTSWASTLELECLAQARTRGIFSAAYLDHWVNFSTRFNDRERDVFPDEIWTGDEEAFAIAKRTFPHRVVRLRRNPYFEKISEDFARLPASQLSADEARILYVCEPVAIDCGSVTIARTHPGYTEFDALRFCLDRLSTMVPDGQRRKVRVRLHPSEKPGKYEPVIGPYRVREAIETAAGTTLLEDCQWSTDVVGCGSMAMIVALLGGRRVYSSIPLPGALCPLPRKDIRYLRDLQAPLA